MGDEEKEGFQPLVGSVIQVLRLERGNEVVFPEEGDRQAIVSLSTLQAELVKELLLKKQEVDEDLFLRIYKTRRTDDSPWIGLVLAGPLGKEEGKSAHFLSEEQIDLWFNQFLTPPPLGEIGKIEKINLEGELSFRLRGGREVGFGKIWNALLIEGRRKREGEKRERQWRREITFSPTKGTPGKEAKARLLKDTSRF